MVKKWSLNIITGQILFVCSLVTLLSGGTLTAQSYNIQFIKSFTCNGEQIAIDQFGNGYIITEDEELIKISAEQDQTFRYSLLQYGKPSMVDVRNPLRILLHFKAFNTIVILDNTLSEKAVIQLQNNGLFQVEAACTASDNNIWIYDAQAFRIKKLSDKQQMLIETEDFQLLFDNEVLPKFMLETGQYLYASDPSYGILVFDLFGGYIKTIPLTDIEQFQIIRDQLLYFKDGRLNGYHLNTFQSFVIPTPELETIKNIVIHDEHLGVLLDNGLNLYAYKAP